MNYFKLKEILFLLIFTFLFYSIPVSAKVYKKEISSGWKFKQARFGNWHDAVVPGVVHTDLMRNNIIEDPFYRMNERSVQWIDKEDWIYETKFEVDDNVIDRNNQYLVFKGLDTYADVYLNDSIILKADNMFVEWKVNVKGILERGKNILKVYFHSPIKIDMPKWESLSYRLITTSNDQSENGGLFNRQVSIFARKAGYHYGWDWGPRLVTSGIWRPVYVESWDDIRIDNVQLIQKNVSLKKADLTSVIEVRSDEDCSDATISITANGKLLSSKNTNLLKGTNYIELNYSLIKPKLWWSNGLGEPYLYDFTTKVTIDEENSDTYSERIGIRSLKLITEKDKDGTSFYFELNGKPVFMKGANYIPNDNFLPRVTEEKYKKTILDAKNANMNMLRVWGGGIYENDIFYDLCDENGILVWQDFMFACALYPGDSEFLNNVRREAEYNVKRLRNHPCLALWCGNNECQDAWFKWGWKEKYLNININLAEDRWRDFKELYYKVLPDVVSKFSPNIPYSASSPLGLENTHSDTKNGDYHYWGVWSGKDPVSSFDTTISRFFSEYGYQSFPEYKTVLKYAPDVEDHDIYSDVMLFHQRGGVSANERIETYMLDNYRKPLDFERFLYVGMLLQGDAVKMAIESHRRNMPYCMGSLFWQHNDCWPVASWSSRDYYGNWKALHYFAKKAFRDILITGKREGDLLKVYCISDRMSSDKGRLRLKVMTIDGKLVYSDDKNIRIYPNTSNCVNEYSLHEIVNGNNLENVIVYVSLEVGSEVYDNVMLLVLNKELNLAKPQINMDFKQKEGYVEITLTSDVFTRGVYLSLPDEKSFFEDNYFDIIPGISKTVVLKTEYDIDYIKKNLKSMSLFESYSM